MKSSYLVQFCLAALLLNAVGCNKDSGGGNPNPAAQRTTDGSDPYGGHGTSQPSGGGNGIDNLPNEMFRKDIESLPEYKHFVLPVLRRMSQGKPDIFLMYLRWAAKSKSWYFVPRELDELSKEKTQVPFKSDQLALHYEKEIYIYAPGYKRNTELARATLLLHEMVMGARFLMKKSPQAQCEALNASEDLELCKDDKFLKIAEPPPPGDQTLNGSDHESVRSMTTFLMDKDKDLSVMNLFARRKQLGFDFPWDITFSKLTYDDLERTLQHSSLAEDIFTAPPSSLLNEKATCMLILSKAGYDYSSISVGAVDPTVQPDYGQNRSVLVGSDNDGPYPRWPKQFRYLGAAWWVATSATTSWYQQIESSGVIDPYGSGKVVDKITVEPSGYATTPDGAAPESTLAEFYISRGASPQLLAFRVIPVRGLQKNVSNTGPGSYLKNVEWVVIKTRTPMECKLANR